MMAGAVLSYFVIGPMIATFGDKLREPVAPADWSTATRRIRRGRGGPIVVAADQADPGLITNMDRTTCGRSTALHRGRGRGRGGIISMCRALPLIIGSITGGLRDLRATRQAAPRICRAAD